MKDTLATSVLTAVTVMAGLLACAREGEVPRRASDLEPIPTPELSHLDGVVKRQLEEAWRRCESGQLPRPDAERADAFADLAHHYHAYQFLEAADVCYRNADRLSQNSDPRWPYARSRLAWRLGNLPESVEHLEEVLRRAPEHPLANLRKAEVYLERDDREAARRQYETVLAGGQRNAAAHFGLGQLALRDGDYEGARDHLRAALAADPRATAVHYPLALAYRELGDDREAHRHLALRGPGEIVVRDPLERVLARITSGSRTQWMRASAALRSGRVDEGVALLQAFVERNPHELDACVDLALGLMQLRKFDAARRLYQRVLAQDPDNPHARTGLGVLFSLTGRDSEAAREHRRALAVNPDFKKARLNLVNALRRSQQFEETLEHHRWLLEVDPANLPIHHATVFTLLRLHRYAECDAALRAAREAFPDDLRLAHVEARVRAACPEAALRDGPKALRLATQVLRSRRSVDHLATWAMALAEVGDFDTATKVQRAAIQVAEAKERPLLLRVLRANLARYEDHAPCRTPWPDDHPLLTPPPLPESESATIHY